MANSNTAMSTTKTNTKRLTYMKSIMKMPEQGFKKAADYCILPCSSTHSVLQIFDDFFTIVSILYNQPCIKTEMLDHIRSEFGYYRRATYVILGKKKLDLVDWLAIMDRKNLPADEICLMASARLLNIHISVDYSTGTWTSFESLSTNHDYILEKSNTHLIYRGSCAYNLLCNNRDLKTKGRKLMDHKMYRMDLLKPLCISLSRIEDHHKGYTSTQHDQNESDITEIYYQTDTTVPYAKAVNDSDSTEIYEIEKDNAVKTLKSHHARQRSIKTNNIKKEKTKKGATNSEIKTKLKKQTFLFKSKNCTSRSNSRKELYLHYKTTHKQVHKCKNCDKYYKTPYSLKQHSYKHRKPQQLLACNKRNKTFAFTSHLMIHRNSHSNYGKYECMECYSVFKYKHDMYRHLREHTVEILECNKCDYSGTALNLKEHRRQHYKKF